MDCSIGVCRLQVEGPYALNLGERVDWIIQESEIEVATESAQ